MTLLRKDTWDQANFDNKLTLLPYSTVQLVGMDGSLLTVHGRATVKLYLEGVSTTTDIVVVSPLMAEAILGLDFLQNTKHVLTQPIGEYTWQTKECIYPCKAQYVLQCQEKDFCMYS